ncbi:MAG: BREX-4 system phosphatase PglZ [Clostridiales bacterium]|nr:BREX-4 system phosphatase PglZ [Clostridiales bacterium]
MTIDEAVSLLQTEKQNNLPSRFPCRAIMVKNIKEYCRLLSELKKISDIRVIESEEIFMGADVMPKYSNLFADSYRDQWVILTGVSEYLRLFSKKEAADRRFAGLWGSQVPASSLGRIIIPLWGCEAQWFDSVINLNGDLRQEDFFFDCTDDKEKEQKMNLLVLSGMFERHVSEFKQGTGTLLVGLLEWFKYWENPSDENANFVLLTKRSGSINSISGEINIHVMNDTLSYIQENMPGGQCLTKENCSDEMQSELFGYALQGVSLDDSLLKILNVSSFSGVDVMGKWNVLSVSHKNFVKLRFQIHPDNSYLSRCFAAAESVDDVPSIILHEIFERRIDKPDWVDEFKTLASVMKIKPDSDYFKAVDAIPEFEKRLDYIKNDEREERIYLLKMVGQWLRKDAEQVNGSEKLKEAFPALSAYLSRNPDVLQSDIGAYMSRYKAHKLENTLPNDEELYFGGANASSFDYRYAVLSEYEDDDTFILWVDALGIEWLSLLYWGIENNCSGTIKKVSLAQATLPTETCFNEQWKSMSMPYKKLDKLDKLAHKGVVDEPDYYACIEDQMSFVTGLGREAESLLEKYHRVVITGDHGTSRLAARFFHCREGLDAPEDAVVYSHGRYCKLPQNVTPTIPNVEIVKDAKGDRYAVFSNYDHFKQPGFAAGADDENAVYGEVHGGASPEEMLVPVIVIESNKEVQLTTSWDNQTVKISMRKAKLTVSFNRQVESLNMKMAGTQAAVSKIDEGKTWAVVFPGVKAGTYSVEANADGKIVSLPEITLLPALGGGDGDLP